MQKNSSQNCIAAPPVPIRDGTRATALPNPYDFDWRRYASRPASTAAEIESFLLTAISLLRSINSSARSRSSRAFFCAKSLPSSAFFARNSRVTSPDFGANKIPTIAPTPSPTMKYVTLEPTLSAIATSMENRSIALRSAQSALTAIRARMRLWGFRIPKLVQNFLRALPRNDAAQFLQSRPLNVGHAPKFFQ